MLLSIPVLPIKSTPQIISHKKIIFFWTKDSRILLFLLEHYTVESDIIYYQILLEWNSTTKNKIASIYIYILKADNIWQL